MKKANKKRIDIKETALDLLITWNEYAKNDIFTCPSNDTLISYGPGYGGWAVQTNQKALSSYALVGIKQNDAKLINIALNMLRFNFESHIDGDFHCFDGKKWGHTWISVLGLERMMHSVYPLMRYMKDSDKALMEKILVSEADWLLEEYDVKAGLCNDNRPESNAWNGSFLYRVATMYPNTPNAKRYIEKSEEYLFNSISTDADKNHPLYKGSNFFDGMALNHHGYMNVGYMVITLSQIAMLHFYCRDNRISLPQHIYHNVKELWQLVKSLTASDGRLMRIGGDSRIRYCYCQDYCIPVWLFAMDYLNDSDAEDFLASWLEMVKKEVKYNGDGSFLSERCYKLHDVSPIYYTRLESDRANSISMILTWYKKSEKTNSDITRIAEWYDEYHGSMFVQGESNMRSWTWRGYYGSVGLCFPKNDTSMAEWYDNMIGKIYGIGKIHNLNVVAHKDKIFNGGFATLGTLEIEGKKFLAEQQDSDHVANEKIACAALPDGATMVVFQYAETPKDMFSIVHGIEDINISIPNDLFNDCKRTYYCENGFLKRVTLEDPSESTMGKWLNIDNKLGVYKLYGGEDLKLYSPDKRSGEIFNGFADKGIDTGSLYTDIIYSVHKNKIMHLWGNKPLIDTGFVVSCDTYTSIENRHNHQSIIEFEADNVSLLRWAEVLGKDDKSYLIIANFSDADVTLHFSHSYNLTDMYDSSHIYAQQIIEENDMLVLRIN